MDKTVKARVQHKHDTEANWLKATNFIPLASEIIVYDVDENYDYPRIKIGDGVNNINTLPFVTEAYAKKTEIPTSKADLELGNVDNIRQYSTINSPIIVQDQPPEDKSVLWVDPSDHSDSQKNQGEFIPAILTSDFYGPSLPGENGESYTHVKGRIFFKQVNS